MATEYTLKVRLDTSQREHIESLSERTGLTKSEIIKVLLDGVANNRIDIVDKAVVATAELVNLQKGEVKTDEILDFTGVHTFVATEEEVVATDWESLGFGRVLRAFEKNGYPERVIRQMNDSNESMIHDAGRYNPKRHRDDWA